MFKPSFSSRQFPDVPDFGPEHYPDVTDDFNRTKFNIINDLQTTSRQHGDPGVQQAIYKNFQPGGKWDITRQPEFPGYGQDGSPRYGKYGNGAASGQFLKQHLFGNVLGAMGYDLPNSKRPKSQRSFPTEFMPSHLIDNDHIQTGIDSWHDGDKAGWKNNIVAPYDPKNDPYIISEDPWADRHKKIPASAIKNPYLAMIYEILAKRDEEQVMYLSPPGKEQSSSNYFDGGHSQQQPIRIASNMDNDTATDVSIGLPRNYEGPTGFNAGAPASQRLPEMELRPLVDYSNRPEAQAPSKPLYGHVEINEKYPGLPRIAELDATAAMPETVKQTIQDVRKYQQQGVMSPQQAQTLIDNTKLHYLDKQRQENKQALESQSSLLQKELAKIKSGTLDDYSHALGSLQQNVQHQLQQLEEYGQQVKNSDYFKTVQAFQNTMDHLQGGYWKGAVNGLTVGSGITKPQPGEELGYALGDFSGSMGLGVLAGATGPAAIPLLASIGAARELNRQHDQFGYIPHPEAIAAAGALGALPGGVGGTTLGTAGRIAAGAGLGYLGDIGNRAVEQYGNTGHIDPRTLNYIPGVGTLLGGSSVAASGMFGKNRSQKSNAIQDILKDLPSDHNSLPKPKFLTLDDLEQQAKLDSQWNRHELNFYSGKTNIIPTNNEYNGNLWSIGFDRENSRILHPLENADYHTNEHAKEFNLQVGDLAYWELAHQPIPQGSYIKVRDDGIHYYYHEPTDSLFIREANDTPKSYFKPGRGNSLKGKRYFDKQPGTPKGQLE